MRHSFLAEIGGEELVFFDRNSANQYRLALPVQFFYFFGNRLELSFFRLKNEVIMVLAHYRTIGRNYDNIQTVNLQKFLSRSFSRTSHAGELFIKAKIILESN